MNNMGENFVAALQAALRLPDLETRSVSANTHSRAVSLLTLCQYTLLKARIYSFFGKKIMEIDRNIIPTFLTFTENTWMLFYGLP